ncbi:MAG: hypothetical protein BWY38_02975 [Ignavibacteria bacterium ADurb.Bin266]|nr:MAG: hypothetical protein BWY38_02975 [Ignavibacteria bacterium ADurb.Bin266]
MTKKFNNRFLRFTAFVTIFIVSFVILSRKVKDNPIVGDGYENVTIAVGIVQKCSFSLDSKGVPQYKIPTMKREPLWPMIAALCIKAGGLDKFDVETLCVEKYIFLSI